MVHVGEVDDMAKDVAGKLGYSARIVQVETFSAMDEELILEVYH
jgi:hypothetical protein